MMYLVFLLLKPGNPIPQPDTRPDFAPVKMSSAIQCTLAAMAINRLPRTDPESTYSAAECRRKPRVLRAGLHTLRLPHHAQRSRTAVAQFHVSAEDREIWRRCRRRARRRGCSAGPRSRSGDPSASCSVARSCRLWSPWQARPALHDQSYALPGQSRGQDLAETIDGTEERALDRYAKSIQSRTARTGHVRGRPP